MRRMLIYLFCVWIFLSIIVSCKETPTTPELPKKRAKIKVEVANWPLSVDWYWWNLGYNYIFISFSVIISESNGVGGRVSTIQAQLFKENKFITQQTNEGERFNPFGSFKSSFNLKVYGPDYKVDKLTITTKGGDDNGYSFEETVSYNLTW